MLRDKNLIPLSHQHQHALGLCVLIQRALDGTAPDLPQLQSEIETAWVQEISLHFEAEEAHLFPAARQVGLQTLVAELIAEHQALRKAFETAGARAMSSGQMRDFAAQLSAHVRKEERQLFEECQARMDPAILGAVGAALEACFATHQAGGRGQRPRSG